MSDKNTGGPAFPFKGAINDSSGMTLRDYFAAKAMQGLCANGGVVADDMAKAAYILADAMLKAREQ